MPGLLTLQNRQNEAILPLPLDVWKLKDFRLQGASPPWPPTRGSAPGPRWGSAPDPRYTLALPRSPCAPPKLNSWICDCSSYQRISGPDRLTTVDCQFVQRKHIAADITHPNAD